MSSNCTSSQCAYASIIPYTACAAVGIFAFRQLILNVRASSSEQFWRNRAIERREYRDKVEHKVLALYPENVVPPCGDAHDLILDLVANKRTYVSAVMGCVWQSRRVGRSKALNAVTEEFYDEAVEAAERFDSGNFEGLVNKLLLGVPISIKDCIHQVRWMK